jgi:N-acetylgalactosamine-N,N'-diacetylbacillosaminyl-diphospho-undecaprenol 4-alpha-N-acetylgalactosaminyltransferase
MKNEKVVCFVINSLGGGGAERVFSRLVNMLSNTEQDYKIVVVTLDKEEIKNPINDSIKHIQLGYNGSLLKSMFGLRKELGELQPALVVSFLTRSNVSSVFSGFRKTYPIVISERVNTSSHFGSDLKSILKKSFTRFFYEKASSLIAVSKGVKEDLSNFFDLKHKRIDVICNSYSFDELELKAQEYDVEFEKNSFIVCVGRFYKNKNHALLIKALAKAKSTKKLVLLGDGPERATLEALVLKLELQGQVIFKGFIENPYPYIANSAGLISVSLAEGFPNVLAEALVLGKFVVSSDCQSGPSELLDSRVSLGVDKLQKAKYGILIPVNNEAETVAGIELFNDTILIEQYEAKIKPLKNSYSHEFFLSSFEKVIKETLNDL